MALTGRPFAITGARVPAALARRVVHAATSGESGVMGAGDCAVTATPTPSSSVRIAAGGVVMASRYPGASRESYLDVNEAEELLPIAATSSGGGRTDYVIARVDDADYPGGTEPTKNPDGTVSDAWRFTKFSTVTTLDGITYPYALLGKIVIPAGTSIITPSMIDSRPPTRVVVNPRSRRVTHAWTARAAGLSTPTAITQRDPDWNYWPGRAILGANANWVDVPTWATTMIVRVDMAGVLVNYAASYGKLWLDLIPLNNESARITTDATWWDLPQSASGDVSQRTGFTVMAKVALPAALRGSSVQVCTAGSIVSGTAAPTIDVGSSVFLDVTFVEDAHV